MKTITGLLITYPVLVGDNTVQRTNLYSNGEAAERYGPTMIELELKGGMYDDDWVQSFADLILKATGILPDAETATFNSATVIIVLKRLISPPVEAERDSAVLTLPADKNDSSEVYERS